jgi:hypothetical protein
VRLASATETELLDIARGELHWLLSAVRQTQSAGTERLARVEELIRAIDLRRRDRESAASGA